MTKAIVCTKNVQVLILYLSYFITTVNEIGLKIVRVKFRLSEKHSKFEKIFLMVLTYQLIYLVNFKTMRKIFFQIMCASQKVRTLR